MSTHNDERIRAEAEAFLQEVYEELGVAEMDEERRNEFLKSFSEALIERASLALLRALPVEAVARMLEDGSADDPDAVERVLREHLGDGERVRDIVREALREGVDIYKSALEKGEE